MIKKSSGKPFNLGDVVIDENGVHGVVINTDFSHQYPIEVAFMDGNVYTYTNDGYLYTVITASIFYIQHLQYDDDREAFQQTAVRPDATVLVDGVEFGVMVDEYREIPPTGRCAQRCETPEDLYGETILSYRVVSIWTDGNHAPHYDLLGEDLSVPPEINSSDIDEEVLRFCKEGIDYEA